VPADLDSVHKMFDHIQHHREVGSKAMALGEDSSRLYGGDEPHATDEQHQRRRRVGGLLPRRTRSDAFSEEK
jgi:hypothetical protein